jgi:hypothetical protein
MIRVAALLGALAITSAAVVALAPGCVTTQDQSPCNNIPDGGCPGIDTTNCVDPTCFSIYTCQPNDTWTLAAVCPPHEAGTEAEPPPIDAAAGMRDVNVDVVGAFGGPGCVDLEFPDCTLGEAKVCGPGCCCCDDLFVCEDGGWIPWGECLDGAVVQTPNP